MRRIGRFQSAAVITRPARFAGFHRIRDIVHIVEHSAIFQRREHLSKFEPDSHAGDVETSNASGASLPSAFHETLFLAAFSLCDVLQRHCAKTKAQCKTQ